MTAPETPDLLPYWVVERYIAGDLNYYCPGARGRGRADDWAMDHSFACRFSREQDATLALLHLCKSEGRTAQHAIMQDRRSSPSPVEVERKSPPAASVDSVAQAIAEADFHDLDWPEPEHCRQEKERYRRMATSAIAALPASKTAEPDDERAHALNEVRRYVAHCSTLSHRDADNLLNIVNREPASKETAAGEWVTVPREPDYVIAYNLSHLWACTIEEAVDTYAAVLEISAAPPSPGIDAETVRRVIEAGMKIGEILDTCANYEAIARRASAGEDKDTPGGGSQKGGSEV